jgi:uncharacterized protein (TIGR00369 family)
MNGQEMIARLNAGTVPKSSIESLLGVERVGIEDGKATLNLMVSKKHHNPMGTLHGGVLCDLADLAMGFALVSKLDEGELFTTIELKQNFLKPIWEGLLRAEGEVIKRGKKTALLACRVYDEKGSLVSYTTSTCMIIEGELGSNRDRVK